MEIDSRCAPSSALLAKKKKLASNFSSTKTRDNIFLKRVKRSVGFLPFQSFFIIVIIRDFFDFIVSGLV